MPSAAVTGGWRHPVAGTLSVSGRSPCPQRGERAFEHPTIRAVPKSTGERWMGVPEAAEYLGVMRRKGLGGDTGGQIRISESGGSGCAAHDDVTSASGAAMLWVPTRAATRRSELTGRKQPRPRAPPCALLRRLLSPSHRHSAGRARMRSASGPRGGGKGRRISPDYRLLAIKATPFIRQSGSDLGHQSVMIPPHWPSPIRSQFSGPWLGRTGDERG